MFAARNMMFARSGVVAGYEAEAVTYFAAITTAGSSISTANKDAVNNFIVGCKADGIWSAIKASCLLAGPDSLAGALVPLVGDAPTNYNFVSGDYSRTTGLNGDGSTKYLDSNRNNNADPQNSQHLAVSINQPAADDARAMLAGRNSSSSTGSSQLLESSLFPFISRGSATEIAGYTMATGLFGVSRSNASEFNYRAKGISGIASNTSVTPASVTIKVFARGDSSITNHSSARLSFYSIGESLDLSLLDARIATYMAALT